jgi:hypothetical protein
MIEELERRAAQLKVHAGPGHKRVGQKILSGKKQIGYRLFASIMGESFEAFRDIQRYVGPNLSPSDIVRVALDRLAEDVRRYQEQ